MADSIRETIMAAVETALDGAGKPTGLTVHRFKTRPIDKDDLPAMAIYPTDEDPSLETHDGVGTTKRKLTVRVEHRVKTLVGSSDSPDTTLDPLINWGTKGLMADAPLDALIRSIEEVRIVWEAFEADQLYGAAAQDFEIEYATDWDDQETAA